MDRKSIKMFGFLAGALILLLNSRDIKAGDVRSEEEGQVVTTTPGQVASTTPQSEASLNNRTVYYLIGNLVGTVLPPPQPTNKTTLYKHRFRTPPKIRNYKVTFGKRIEGDSQLWETVYRKPIHFGVKQIVTQVPFPEKGGYNSCPITYILVQNAQTVGDLDKDDVLIVSGGISQTHVKIKITSPNFYLYGYRVFVYGKC